MRRLALIAVAGAAAVALAGCSASAPQVDPEERYVALVRMGLDALESRLADDDTSAWEERVLNAGTIWCEGVEETPQLRTNPVAIEVGAESAGMAGPEFTVITQAAEQQLCPE